MKALFVHVPRCGGMSFYYFLEEIFGKNYCMRFGDNASVEAFLAQDNTYEHVACLSGHVPYQYFHARNCQHGRFTVAFVRNPQERELSCFSHMRDYTYADHVGVPTDTQINYWHHFNQDEGLHNIQCSYFSSERKFRQATNAILENRICVFDITDIYVIADMIKTFVGLDYMPSHTNISNRDMIELADPGRESISMYCDEDKKLHAWIIEHKQYFLSLLKNELWKSYLQREIQLT